ncbi:hypothetical protein FAGKG844_570006 [Frankia sp. AgKG'84/4]
MGAHSVVFSWLKLADRDGAYQRRFRQAVERSLTVGGLRALYCPIWDSSSCIGSSPAGGDGRPVSR